MIETQGFEVEICNDLCTTFSKLSQCSQVLMVIKMNFPFLRQQLAHKTRVCVCTIAHHYYNIQGHLQ